MNPPSFHPLEERFEQAWPVADWRDSHVVLAVSGGPDSLAMLRAAIRLKEAGGGSGKLFVGHLNHSLRGDDADADAAWLAALCNRLSIPLEVGKADVSALAAEAGDGVEAAARSTRYEFLRQTAERLGARFVVVAHTADDQVETVLHRIVRGTGLAGLAGIRRSRPLSPSVSLVRPLLQVRRSEVLDYLAAIGQGYRTDASNFDSQWTRNRLRAELLPLLRERFSGEVDSALLRLAKQAGEVKQFVSSVANDIAKESTTIEYADELRGAAVHPAKNVLMECRTLAGQPPLMIREVCRHAWTQANWPQQAMGFRQWQ